MRARVLIIGAVFGPEALKAAIQAFDIVWSQIAPQFDNNPQAIEAARVRLAHAVLAVADDNIRDSEVVKELALKAMALSDRGRHDVVRPWPSAPQAGHSSAQSRNAANRPQP
jgi:hypothetical protein